jgi:site-specific DNA-methyltransferase (adenine-specific)
MLRSVNNSGLLFVYGEPDIVPYYSKEIDQQNHVKDFVFKYYIAARTLPRHRDQGIINGHKALILHAPRDTFKLSKVRIPHSHCRACRQNLRDWGGKKHLMHPAGAALSDVWKDLSIPYDEELPQDILDRISLLSPKETPRILLVRLPSEIIGPPATQYTMGTSSIDGNRVILGDCLEVMRQLPEGSVDLAFADPPYNLDKAYFSYDDSRHDEEYIAWCEQWLFEYQRLLKPSGSLFVVNLPKWSVYHKTFLDKYLQFQNWIVWDALSEPRGRLMPAHYAILYYTKHPSKYVFNRDQALEMSSDYCMRRSCVKMREKSGIDDQTSLTDIWWDIPRIKHKKLRDIHPCQLPEKLMHRIIALASKTNDLVFDAFSGTGTTAVVAKQMGRYYLTIDVDKYYVELTLNKLELLDKWGTIPRSVTNRQRPTVTKKELQLELLRLASQLHRLPTEEEVDSNSKYPLEAYLTAFPSFGKALRAAKVHGQLLQINQESKTPV